MRPVWVSVPVILLTAGLSCGGCLNSGEKEAENEIRKELDLLKELDYETARKYFSPDNPLQDLSGGEETQEDLSSLASAFFRNFDYEVSDIKADKKNGTASATLHLKTPDTQALARDYAAACLKADMMNRVRETQDSPVSSSSDAQASCEILNRLLKENEYDTLEDTCPAYLVMKDGAWNLLRTESLENSLTGGLMTALSDAEILSPDETLAIILDTLKEMDEEDLARYLGLSSLYPEEDSSGELTRALVHVLKNSLDYRILDVKTNGYRSDVTVELTTFDSGRILESFQQQADEYLATADAVIDGESVRAEKLMEILITCIKDSTRLIQNKVVFHMVNDGVSWKLSGENQQLGSALFGSLPDEE